MRSEQIKNVYSRLAKEYDNIVLNKAKYVAYKKMGLLTIKELNKQGKEDAEILDLGCGTGLSSLEFFKKGYRVTGIDIAEGMIKEAKKLPFERLVCQDIEAPLQVKDTAFDAVVLVGVMEFMEKPAKVFREVRRKLVTDGIFSLTVPVKRPRASKLNIKSYYKKEMEPVFKKAGFIVLKCEKIFGYKKQGETVQYYGYVLKKGGF